MTYRPLPKELTIAKSKIEGLGLFASEDIKKGVILGISHVRDNRFENGFIRQRDLMGTAKIQTN
mgnify:CR=1 FL=1